MDQITEMVKELMTEIKEMRNDLKEYREEVKLIREENKTMKEVIQNLRVRIENLEQMEDKMEQIEKNNRKKNIIVKGLRIKGKSGMEKEIETFIKNNLQVEIKAMKATEIKDDLYIVETENFEQKIAVMKNKNKLRNVKTSRVYINNDLTLKERKIQKTIQEQAGELRKDNNRVIVGYQKMIVNGEKYKWNDREKKMEKEQTNSVPKNWKN